MRKLRWRAISLAVLIGVTSFVVGRELLSTPRPSMAAGYGAHPSRTLTAASAIIDDGDAGFMTYYHRGLAYKGLGQYELALADLDMAQRLSPTPRSAQDLGADIGNSFNHETMTLRRVFFVHVARAELLEEMNRPAEAVEALNRAIALQRKTAEVQLRANLHSVLGQYDAAIADFDGLLAQRTDVSWIIGRGVAKFFNGDFSAAAADFRDAARRRPDDRDGEIWLTRASQQAGLPEPVGVRAISAQ
jgi:tetratricopeptide (TPR) repeat protein